MKLSIETDSYNERRYGKPYIGALSPDDGRVVRWGAWIGTPGQAGILEIEVDPGQPVIVGQKDTRGNNSTARYGVIGPGGDIEYVAGKAAAVLAAREATTASPTQAVPTLADLLAALGVSNTIDAMARIRALTDKA